MGLARSDFFTRAAFHGGACFRILDGLDRFSEDLDFSLKQPDLTFTLEQIIPTLQRELCAWGLETEVIDRSKTSNVIKKAFLKESSLGV